MQYLFGFLSAAGYGFNNVCIHMGMRRGHATSGQALVINLLSGTILLTIVAAVMYFTMGLPPINLPGLFFLVLSGLTAPFLGRILSISSIKRIGGTRAATLKMGETLFTIPLAYFIIGDVLTLKAIFGVIVLVAGLVLLINETGSGKEGSNKETAQAGQTDGKSAVSQRFVRWFAGAAGIGIFYGIVSSFFMSLGGITRQMATEYIPSAIMGALLSTLVALVANGSMVFLSGGMGKGWTLTRSEIFYFALGGLSNTTGLVMFFFSLLAGGMVAITSALKNTSPVFTLVFSWIMLRKVERFTLKLLFSIAVVIAGATIVII